MKSARNILPVLLALAWVPIASADPVDEQRILELARPRWKWGPHAVSRIYGLSYVEEDEPDGGPRLRGVSLLYSSWDETVSFSGGFGWFLSWQDGGGQTIWDGGLEMTWLPWVPKAPVRIGPRLRLGLQHRRSDPDEGFGGLAAAGVELAFWLGDGFQIALLAEHEWPFPADDRTRVGLALRFARRRY